MQPTALLVSNKYPFPADDGKKTVLSGFLRYLVDRYGAGNVLLVVVGRRGAGPLPPVPCATLWIAPPGRLRQVLNLAAALTGLRAASLQEAMLYSPGIAARLATLVSERTPALVILDTLRVGQYFEAAGPRSTLRVLYMDDLFHLRFERMLALSRSGEGATLDPAGTFAPFLPKIARAVLRVGVIRNLLYRIETARIRARELASPRRFDRCLLINPNEAALLRGQCREGEIDAVPPLVFPEPCTVKRRYDGGGSFLLFGSLRHPVYRASVIGFLGVCAPRLVERMPDVRLEIVGEGADEEIERLCERLGPHAKLLGFVDRIDGLFARACALVVPLVAAGGLKLKAVTALYYGLPIVATAHAMDGIPLEPGRDYVLEERIERFPERMAELRDPALNRRISAAASDAFRRHFSRERIFAEYDALFAPPRRTG